MAKLLKIIGILLFTVSCTSRQDKHPPEPMPADTAAVVEQGNRIMQSAFATLSSNLSVALEDGGVSNALKFCNVEALALTDSLAGHYGITLRRASHRPRNSKNMADTLELASIRKYIEKLEKEGELKPFVYHRQGKILFHAPIRITGGLCLNCHGSPGTDIAQSDLEVIRELYPEDKATGFELGELRGIWSIEFPNDYFIEDE